MQLRSRGGGKKKEEVDLVHVSKGGEAERPSCSSTEEKKKKRGRAEHLTEGPIACLVVHAASKGGLSS